MPEDALAGVRVVSLAVNVPGPVAVAELARLGAAVVTVEPPTGDPLATVAPDWYARLHAGVEVRRVDLKDATGRAELEPLLDAADVLVTASRPDALARLGLDPASVRAARPRLVVVSIVGDRGERSRRAGHDLTYVAAAGLLQPPALPQTLLADLSGAAQVVSAVLATLLRRERTGAGGVVQVALADAVAGLRAPLEHGLTAAGGPLGGGYPLYGLYPAAEGWVAVAALEPHFAARLLQALDLAATPAEKLADALRQRFADRTAHEWERWAEEHDLPLAAVR